MNADVQIGRKLGKIVHESEWMPKREPPVVLLVMDPEKARHELPFYLQLNPHPNTIQSFGLVTHDPRSTILLQERALHGDLLHVLQTGQFQPSEPVLWTIFLQIVKAMSYLAEQNIVHGDLRCENILVFRMNSSKPEENHVKLTNFNRTHRMDSATTLERQAKPHIRYCAPELLEDTSPSDSSEFSDMFSMGVLMWQAYSRGSLPYGPDASDDVIRQRRLDDMKLPKPDSCNVYKWPIITDCYCREPAIRYSFQQMLTRLSASQAK
jgi:serine/threonine protein kinase